jgi:N-acetylgalactosamine-N,N'-diacetylbacillosaminyl-diphospho-undecaprenol 4-alpha-N-acetylgalactosaminyltransferase
MKIAHVINTLSGGGAEKVAVGVLRCLEKEYKNTFIIAKNVIKIDIDFTPEILFNFEKKPFYLPAFVYEKILLKKLEEKLKSFDIVISHLRDMNTRLCLLKSQERLKPKLIIVEHVTKELYSSKELKTIKKLYRYADVSVAVSEKVSENLKEYGARNIKVIENFIDIEEIYRKANEVDINFNGFSFLGIGRLSYDKGFDILIKAFKMANIENSKLYILGEGSKRKDLLDLVNKLDLKEKVIFLGFQKNPYPYIKSCDVFVTSSRREAFPMATLEAMALKKPLISTNVVPFVKDQINALVVPVNSEEALADAMLKIYRDKYLKEKISSEAFLTAINYNKQQFCKNYNKLIENTIKQP